MEDNNNNQPPKKIENEIENSKDKPLIEYENGWTVEDTMALYPELTEEEAIIAHRMGW